MRWTIYTECPDKVYYRALYKTAGIRLAMIDSRFLYLVVTSLLGRKKNSFSRILRSFAAPFELLFHKNIIVAFAPYGNIVYYLLFLKLLGKNLVYSTSWPYWRESGKAVKQRWFFNVFVWRMFLKNLKTINCNEAGAASLEALGARSSHIPHAVDTDIFYPKPVRHQGFRVLFVGRLVEEKGILELLDLAQALPHVDFWIVGKGPLAEKVANTSENIHYLDKVSDRKKLAEIYNSCDALILLSKKTSNWEEFFGIVLIEAMACGLPIIASRDGVGPREIVDASCGILVSSRKVETLKEAVIALLEDPVLRKKLGKGAVARIKNHYDFETVISQWAGALLH